MATTLMDTSAMDKVKGGSKFVDAMHFFFNDIREESMATVNDSKGNTKTKGKFKVPDIDPRRASTNRVTPNDRRMKKSGSDTQFNETNRRRNTVSVDKTKANEFVSTLSGIKEGKVSSMVLTDTKQRRNTLVNLSTVTLVEGVISAPTSTLHRSLNTDDPADESKHQEIVGLMPETQATEAEQLNELHNMSSIEEDESRSQRDPPQAESKIVCTRQSVSNADLFTTVSTNSSLANSKRRRNTMSVAQNEAEKKKSGMNKIDLVRRASINRQKDEQNRNNKDKRRMRKSISESNFMTSMRRLSAAAITNIKSEKANNFEVMKANANRMGRKDITAEKYEWISNSDTVLAEDRRRRKSLEIIQNLNKSGKGVKFSDIEIRSYDITLGDHPDCMVGPPITLDWDYVTADNLAIDKYESERSPRRYGRALRSSFVTRETLLKEAGFSKFDFKAAVLAARTIRKNRNESKILTSFHEKVLGPSSDLYKVSFISLFKKSSNNTTCDNY